jgi:hypothetical protein
VQKQDSKAVCHCKQGLFHKEMATSLVAAGRQPQQKQHREQAPLFEREAAAQTYPDGKMDRREVALFLAEPYNLTVNRQS